MQLDLLSLSNSTLLAQADSKIAEATTELGSAPYIVLGGYLLLLLVLGIIGWRKSSGGEEDYYLAGRKQGWLVSSLTIMATFFSSFALLGAPGLVYKEGVTLALFSLNVPVAGLGVYLLGSRIWKIGRKFGYDTPGDMVADYYGSKFSLRFLVAATGVMYSIPYVVMQIQAGGILSEKMFVDVDNAFEVGSILLAAITTLYIMIGGMRSVAWTDLIQGLLLIFGMLVCGFAMLLLFDGPFAFSERVVTELPASSLTVPGSAGGWPWTLLFTVCVLGSVGSMVQPAQWMRFYSARNVKTLKQGAVIFAAVLTTCFILGVMLIGIAGQVLYPLKFTQSVEVAADANVTVPDELKEQFSVSSSGGKSSLKWTWYGNNRMLDDTQVTQLKALSDDESFATGVDSLAAVVNDPTAQAAVAPNPNVDADVTDRADFDAILVVVLQKQLPQLMGGFGAAFASLIIVAIMAASMSTADSNLHAMSAVLTRDVYDQFIRPQATENERVWVGRIIIVVATVIALLAVIFGRNPEIAEKYEFMNMIAKMGLMAIAFSAQLLPITIDILFLQKGTGKGAAAGLAVGLFAAFLCGPLYSMSVDLFGAPAAMVDLQNWVNSIKFTSMHGSVWGLAINIPVFVLVSLVTRKPDAAKIDEYRKTFAS